MSYHHIKRCRKMLWELARVESWAHFEVMRRVHGGGTLEAARSEVDALYERHGEAALNANGTPGDPVELLAEVFPELPEADIKAAVRYYRKQSRRLERWAAKRGVFSRALNKRPRQPMKGTTRTRAISHFRAPGRMVGASSRKEGACPSKGGDDGGGGDGDPDAEPPAGQYRNLTFPASSWAQQSLSEIKHSSFPSLRRPCLPRSWRFVWGWAS